MHQALAAAWRKVPRHVPKAFDQWKADLAWIKQNLYVSDFYHYENLSTDENIDCPAHASNGGRSLYIMHDDKHVMCSASDCPLNRPSDLIDFAYWYWLRQSGEKHSRKEVARWVCLLQLENSRVPFSPSLNGTNGKRKVRSHLPSEAPTLSRHRLLAHREDLEQPEEWYLDQAVLLRRGGE
jgi:hypothetical protein